MYIDRHSEAPSAGASIASPRPVYRTQAGDTVVPRLALRTPPCLARPKLPTMSHPPVCTAPATAIPQTAPSGSRAPAAPFSTSPMAVCDSRPSLPREVAEGVAERLRGCDALGGVESGGLVEQVGEHHHLAVLSLGQLGATGEERLQVVAGHRPLLKLDQPDHVPPSHPVLLRVQKVVVGVKVQLGEDALADELVRHLALHLHDDLEHLIVGVASEHDLTRVQLVQRGGRGPHVDGAREVQAHHDLGRAVEARNHVGRDLLVVRIDGRTEVTDLKHVVAVVDHHVVRLEIGVHDAELLHVPERHEELPRVGAHRVDLDAPPVAKLLDCHAQVLVQGLEDHAQVILVVEAA
mmetsp:Transcript_32544/g.105120  ORF Transcript_32544/g.105120 Transcript_32544/m.105120 type:complete len:350 (+) Transcript_32544:248-1297(+)